jgi:hypothetical protein
MDEKVLPLGKLNDGIFYLLLLILEGLLLG